MYVHSSSTLDSIANEELTVQKTFLPSPLCVNSSVCAVYNSLLYIVFLMYRSQAETRFF